MARWFTPAVLALVFLGHGASTAQQAPPDAAPPRDQVIVTGQPSDEQIRNFVGQLAIAPKKEDQLAHWDRRICPSIMGLRNPFAQFIVDRIAQRGFKVDLDVGKPGCKANILIIVTLDPDKAARELFDNNRKRLGTDNDNSRNSLGREQAAAFVQSDAPVRWWHVNHTVTRDGDVIGDTISGSGKDYPVLRLTGNASLLKRATHQDFATAIIIVDANRLKGVGAEQLADYLAMVALAQIDPKSDPAGFPTILNLFAPRAEGVAAPTGMTDWDIAYLHGLYDTTRDEANSKRQEREIAKSMAKTLPKP